MALEADFFDQDLLYGVENILFGTVNKPGVVDLSHHEDILRMASKFSVEEIVEQVKAAKPNSDTNNRRVSNRLDVAKDQVAKARGVERRIVTNALSAAKRVNGVDRRKNLRAGQRRKARKSGAILQDVDSGPAASTGEMKSGADAEVDVEAEPLNVAEQGQESAEATSPRRIAGETTATIASPSRDDEEKGTKMAGDEAAKVLMSISKDANQ